MNKKTCTAIVLSAGQGKRMGTTIQKQYIQLDGKEIICHTLETFQNSSVIDDIVLVVGKRAGRILQKRNCRKVPFHESRKIAEGGEERYHSVLNGLREITHQGYVFIHDGARPFVSEEIMERAYDAVCRFGACVVGMPVKDTIKIVDKEKFISKTPDRRFVWQVQTPQTFRTTW